MMMATSCNIHAPVDLVVHIGILQRAVKYKCITAFTKTPSKSQLCPFPDVNTLHLTTSRDMEMR